MFLAFCFDAKTIPHLLGLGETKRTPKIEIVFKIFTSVARKIAKQKSRYILRATETSVEENFFPRRYSVLNPKYVTALN